MELPRHVERCPLRDVRAEIVPTAPTRHDPASADDTRAAIAATARALAEEPAPLVDPALARAALHAEAKERAASRVDPADPWGGLVRAARRATHDLGSFAPHFPLMVRLARDAQREARNARNAAYVALGIALVALALVVLVEWNSRNARTAQATTAASPTRPQVRPPYNPALHGSLEEYRATYAHLPVSLPS